LPDLKRFQPKSRKAWRAWLEKHHATSPGIWLVYAKKHTRIPSLTYNDAFTPRKTKSAWSAVNRTRAERLIEAGVMTAAGLALVASAKKTGLWKAHAAAESLTLPPELKKALDSNPAAKKNWPTYTDSQRKMFLYMVNGAKRPETRAKRVARVIDIVSSGVKFSQVVAESMKRKKT
jgi:uncharacterized protein YdeI (YjbR/CyaY-like superfamily)